ncbi:MAG: hypothetical protein ACI4VR_02755 [Bacilli bacterium]
MKKRNIFFSCLYILSFIIMIIGSTLAYFSFRTTSDKNVINASSLKDSSVTISVSQVSGGGDLFPLKDDDIMKAYNRNCVDDNGNMACNKYAVTLNNTGNSNYLDGKIKFNTSNNLVNLYFMMIDSKGSVYVPTTKIENDKYYNIGKSLKMKENSDFSYTLIVWLRNLDENQNSEMNGNYKGTISYNTITDKRLINEIESSYVGG